MANPTTNVLEFVPSATQGDTDTDTDPDKLLSAFIDSNVALLLQLSGYLFITSNQSIMKFMNKENSKILGYRNPDQCIDEIYENIPCRIAEDADDYVRDDKRAIRDGEVSFMTYHCFSGNTWRLLLGTRKAILNENNHNIGVMITAQDITHSGLVDLVRFLLNNKKSYPSKLDNKYFCYYLDFNRSEHEYELSNRQQECLFYLLRGFTSKHIAKMLFISNRTVECHLEQLKTKFRVSNKMELIEKAMLKGYYSYLPKTLLTK